MAFSRNRVSGICASHWDIEMAHFLNRGRQSGLLYQAALLLGTLSGALACHDLSGLTGTQQLPAGTPDPGAYHTAAGALALYQTTIATFQYSNGVTSTSLGSTSTSTAAGAFVDFVLRSGLLTDELQAGDIGCTGISCQKGDENFVDARQLPEGTGSSLTNKLYNELQYVRNDAALGIGALEAYDSAASPALRGHLYALAGYAELLLADLYCSGIPLSTINFNGDFTYAPGSTTAQVYQDAIAKFDMAIALSRDSVRILNLARVGKGRALLALGAYDSAAQAVASVPDGFTYQFLVDWTGGFSDFGGNLFNPNNSTANYTVADQEGGTGLPFISSGDPRTASQAPNTNPFSVPQYVPLKYGGTTPGTSPITVADWIEARLIRAEAALQAKDYTAWLTQLNTLRETATVPGQTIPLADTADPGQVNGSDSARVSLLFHERAYWLFVTGHRQGDLRRLIREYHRSADQVYPTGLYPLSQLGVYGNDVTAPINDASESANPLFHSCLSRGA